MKCSKCNSEDMLKMVLVANQIWRVKIAEESKKNKYDTKSWKSVNAFVCQNCGNIELSLEKSDDE